jgi:hypothetical protein
MFKRTIIILAILTSSLTACKLATPAARASENPSRDDLQRMLLTPQDLAPLTQAQWKTLPIRVDNVGPAGQSDGTGCAELDKAVLARNTGLVDSGAQVFVSGGGDFIEQTIAFDRSAAAHVGELAMAVSHCPEMTFADGPKVTVRPMSLGDGTAGFRGIIGGVSRSVVLTGAHGNYVVELIASDHGQSDAYYQALLDRAFYRIDHP